MRLLLCVLLVVSALTVLQGCVMPNAPVGAALIFHEKGPVTGFDNDVKATRVGKAVAEGIILVGYGDASINAAKANGGITKIHHVDCKVFNILNMYCYYETVVYGE